MTASIDILWTEPYEEVRRDPIGEHWCFGCRAKREFVHRVLVPVEPSYYGGINEIICATCGLVDGDMFPGRSREWSEG